MIIDASMDVTASLPALKAAGVDTVIRYLNPLDPGGEKNVKPDEARALAAAGVALALVCEVFGQPTHRDPLGGVCAAAGARDGKWCRDYMASLGPVPGAAVFFAMDWDASSSQIAHLVTPHFQAVHPFFADGTYRIGVYGSGNVCAAMLAASLADVDWLAQSKGWGGYAAREAESILLQGAATTVAGVPCDTDEARGDFGAFLPFASPPQKALRPDSIVERVVAGIESFAEKMA